MATNWVATATFTDLVAIDPDSVTYEGTGDINCTVLSDQEITCTGDTLAVDERAVARFDVIPSGPGTGSWEASVTADQVDPRLGDNAVSGPFEVYPVDDPDPAGSGDWGTTGSDLMAPGTSKYYDVAFTCLSAGGCDYGPGMTITDQAATGTSFNPGSNYVYVNGETNVGECEVTSTDINCAVTESGHADQGDTLSSLNIGYVVSEDAPADTQVFAQTISFPTGWTGNDPSNDVYPISTPTEVPGPMVSWQIGAGLGGLVLLLGGGALLWRRRQQQPQPVAA
ncbi:MAG TPA: hypothetical protein H9815_06175 [Candidatus Ruania gallistercoris]|uniref:Uncharacterized protein n=1 Tax=Candidatus Ruania gallistercoris TaxID=2838746 RepID=A0A9D2J3K2_9MICO|nr:hypothetical protein [Candidatus Ruania gallistercoris]